VSLTVYDELARWEKYAYGCNELLFHPIRKWIYKGPFTPLFRRFLFSNIRFTSKITVVSYIGTYYAIGAAWIMTSVNYFIMGWFNGYLDKYYVDSWQVWFSIILVFNGLGNIALAVMRYRVGERNILYALFENFKWTFLLAIFLGGLSLHVSQALLAHMFEIDMTWGATSKEAEFSNFFIEVPKVLKKVCILFFVSCFLLTGMLTFLTVQILHDLRLPLHRRHGHPRRRPLHPLQLAHHRLCRHSAHGYRRRLASAAAAGPQPRAHDLLLVDG
jgi:hypothetical protein